MGHRPAGSHRGAVDPALLWDVLRGVLMLTGPEAGRPGGVFAVSSCQDPVCFVSLGHDHVHGLAGDRDHQKGSLGPLPLCPLSSPVSSQALFYGL